MKRRANDVVGGGLAPGRTAVRCRVPTEIDTNRGRTIVVGGGGQLRILDAGGNFEAENLGIDTALHGAEVMEDGSVIAVGDDGTIVEGTPAN